MRREVYILRPYKTSLLIMYPSLLLNLFFYSKVTPAKVLRWTLFWTTKFSRPLARTPPPSTPRRHKPTHQQQPPTPLQQPPILQPLPPTLLLLPPTLLPRRPILQQAERPIHLPVFPTRQPRLPRPDTLATGQPLPLVGSPAAISRLRRGRSLFHLGKNLSTISKEHRQ